jgi:hypothetical protein
MAMRITTFLAPRRILLGDIPQEGQESNPTQGRKAGRRTFATTGANHPPFAGLTRGGAIRPKLPVLSCCGAGITEYPQ